MPLAETTSTPSAWPPTDRGAGASGGSTMARAVAAVVERARLPRGAAPARPPHASVLSSGVEGGLKRPLPASPPSLPSCSVLARSRARACVRAPGSAYRCAVGRARRGSGGRLDGAEDCGTVSVSVRSTSFVRPRPFARPSVPPPQHLAGSSRWSFVVVGHPRRTKGAFLESKLAACLSIW